MEWQNFDVCIGCSKCFGVNVCVSARVRVSRLVAQTYYVQVYSNWQLKRSEDFKIRLKVPCQYSQILDT